MLDDPAAAAWTHARRPTPPFPVKPDPEPCARCGDTTCNTIRSATIISEQFTGFDDWPYGTRRLCVPCAWAYYALAPTARALHWTITADRTLKHRTPRALAARLAAGPLDAGTAAVLAVDRRHYVLPGAQWGQLRCDQLSITWTAQHAATLTQVQDLRALGCRWVELTQQQPPRSFLSQHPISSWLSITDSWQQVAPWRAIPTLWAAARTLTD